MPICDQMQNDTGKTDLGEFSEKNSCPKSGFFVE